MAGKRARLFRYQMSTNVRVPLEESPPNKLNGHVAPRGSDGEEAHEAAERAAGASQAEAKAAKELLFVDAYLANGHYRQQSVSAGPGTRRRTRHWRKRAEPDNDQHSIHGANPKES
jgi:hypothetical protein